MLHWRLRLRLSERADRTRSPLQAGASSHRLWCVHLGLVSACHSSTPSSRRVKAASGVHLKAHPGLSLHTVVFLEGPPSGRITVLRVFDVGIGRPPVMAKTFSTCNTVFLEQVLWTNFFPVDQPRVEPLALKLGSSWVRSACFLLGRFLLLSVYFDFEPGS